MNKCSSTWVFCGLLIWFTKLPTKKGFEEDFFRAQTKTHPPYGPDPAWLPATKTCRASDLTTSRYRCVSAAKRPTDQHHVSTRGDEKGSFCSGKGFKMKPLPLNSPPKPTLRFQELADLHVVKSSLLLTSTIFWKTAYWRIAHLMHLSHHMFKEYPQFPIRLIEICVLPASTQQFLYSQLPSEDLSSRNPTTMQIQALPMPSFKISKLWFWFVQHEKIISTKAMQYVFQACKDPLEYI